MSRDERPWLTAIGWMMAMFSLFFLSYGLSNFVASRRVDVPSVAFEWERNIPFLAWTIVPYWSLDVLYAASFLACRTTHQLLVLVKRLAAVQGLSVAVFLIAPLRFSFEQPKVAGFYGALFDWLGAFDQPFNQTPSLHVGIAVVLWQSCPIWLRGWLALIMVSTLTTYQHHFVDIPTGVLAGLAAVALFGTEENTALRLGAIYGIGSGLLVAVAASTGGWGWLLLWPAIALLIPAIAYCLRQPLLFGKTNRLMTLLEIPYLAGAWMNVRLRRDKECQPVAAGVWLGGLTFRSDARFRSVVDVTAEFPWWGSRFGYRSVPMLDLIPPPREQLAAAVRAIEEAEGHRPTLVCCALGRSRSAAVVAAWLMKTGRASTAAEGIAAVRRVRPNVVLSEGHAAAMTQAAYGV